MLEKLNLNWSAVWRKAVVGGVAAMSMGYMYKANKNFDAATDAKYPAPKDQVDNSEETS